MIDFYEGDLCIPNPYPGATPGERFVETRQADWSRRLAAWKADRALPAPLPQGHLHFAAARKRARQAATAAAKRRKP